MTCEQYADIETAERYVAGVMAQDEEVAYEQHFLDCDACLDTIRGVEDVRDVLIAARATAARAASGDLSSQASTSSAGAPQTRPANGASNVITMPLPAASSVGSRSARDARETVAARRDAVGPSRPPARVPRWAWAAAAAVLIGAVLWMRALAPTPQHPEVARTTPVTDPGPAPTPTPQPPPPPSAEQLAQARIAQIAKLALVVAPPYVSVPVRAERDDTTRTFEAAMSRYRAQDYAGAADRLRALVATAPETAAAQFFLGISELMRQQPDRAEGPLRRAASSDVTPFADEAHFYLAKAALQRNDLATAERELTQAIARDAGPENEARNLLNEVRKLKTSAPR